MATSSGAPSTINLFSLLATVLFIIAIALSGGVYFYQGIVQKQIDNASASLDRAKAAFEPDTINQIVRLDTRIETGKKLLASHISITPFFDLLSSITLKSVRYKDFSFSYAAADKISVSMKGQATSYAAVALESDLLNTQKRLKNTILTDMTLEPAGTVSFNVSTIIDQGLLAYSPINVGSASIIPTPAVINTVATSSNIKAK